MKEKVNLKKLKAQKNILGVGFVASLSLCAYGFFNNFKNKLLEFKDAINNNPDKIDLFTEIFEKYDCENYAEFQQFLSDNSNNFTQWIYVDGVPQQIVVTRYNQIAQPAVNEFNALQNSLENLPLQDLVQYFGIDAGDVALFAVIPSLFVVGYGIKRHQYKKACKRAEQAKKELAEMEAQ